LCATGEEHDHSGGGALCSDSRRRHFVAQLKACALLDDPNQLCATREHMHTKRVELCDNPCIWWGDYANVHLQNLKLY
jgi:hypothetical protein